MRRVEKKQRRIDIKGEINFINILANSRKIFFYFVKECNDNYREGDDLNFYREIIDMHKKTRDLSMLMSNENFFKKIHDTLIEWNMDQRGAILADLGTMKKSIWSYRANLVELHENKLYSLKSTTDEIFHKIIDLLRHIFCNLKVMETKRRIVGVAKALHFLLPDLVIPIDGKYTMECFYGYNKNAGSPEKEFVIFKEIFVKTYYITKKLNLTQNDVDGKKWNTSVPKLIDNACIGFLNYKDKNDAEMTLSLIEKLLK